MVQAGPNSWILFHCQISSGFAPPQQPSLSQHLVDSLALHGLMWRILQWMAVTTLKDWMLQLRTLQTCCRQSRLMVLVPGPHQLKLRIGGFSMGAAASLYSAACYAHGKFTSGIPYPITLSAVISLSGWLPCSRTLRGKMESSHIAARRAASLPILLSHGRADEVVSYRNAERSSDTLRSSGFLYLHFKSYNGLGHYTIPEEMDDVGKWLSSRLGLDRSR
ncbi:acyl-protein thioesterase 1-like isoform X2 [Oryza glaberrima]|uniref:acyl-protein thioesterase 1-like isoform X2 n=1 Tax=Oryza glaberrima TaxID=4538 RepID=UPI00224C03CC|nr:acyl-protein thioesterase 1-like isoform X2 [Oryza glaberrima]